MNRLKKPVNTIPETIAPSKEYGHPIADLTRWDQVQPRGTFFAIQRLRLERGQQIVFELLTSSKCLIFFKLLLLLGFIVLVAFDSKTTWYGKIFAFCICFYLLNIVFGAYWYKRDVRVFDGFLKQFYYFNKRKNKIKYPVIDYKDFVALQIIFNDSRAGEWWSYELNLVYQKGKRINIAEHGRAKHIRQDALFLSTQLGIPVWDATKQTRIT